MLKIPSLESPQNGSKMGSRYISLAPPVPLPSLSTPRIALGLCDIPLRGLILKIGYTWVSVTITVRSQLRVTNVVFFAQRKWSN